MRGLPQASARTTLLTISRFDGASTDKELAEPGTDLHVQGGTAAELIMP